MVERQVAEACRWASLGMKLSEIIEQRIAREFSTDTKVRARNALARYGAEEYQRETERVLNAILDLAKGDVSELELLLDRALKDFRDILFWHDNPDEANLDTQEKRDKFKEMIRRFGIKGIGFE